MWHALKNIVKYLLVLSGSDRKNVISMFKRKHGKWSENRGNFVNCQVTNRYGSPVLRTTSLCYFSFLAMFMK